MDPTAAGPSSDKKGMEEAVLTQQLLNRSALKNATSGGNAIEDEDLALAKILQEQERAFLVLSSNTNASSSDLAIPTVENVPPPPRRLPPSSSGHSPPPTDDIIPLTDEELAWKLMQEEEAEFQQRMLALAGVRLRSRSPHLPRHHRRDRLGSAYDEEAEGEDAEGSRALLGYEQNDARAGLYARANAYRTYHHHHHEVDSDADVSEEEEEDNVPDIDAMSYEELTALGDIVGTVPTGLSQDQINRLPVKKYRKQATPCSVQNAALENMPQTTLSHSVSTAVTAAAAAAADDDGDIHQCHCNVEEAEQCVICRIEYENEDDVVVLPCHHVYHPECIAQWFARKKACPQCNAEVVVDE